MILTQFKRRIPEMPRHCLKSQNCVWSCCIWSCLVIETYNDQLEVVTVSPIASFHLPGKSGGEQMSSTPTTTKKLSHKKIVKSRLTQDFLGKTEITSSSIRLSFPFLSSRSSLLSVLAKSARFVTNSVSCGRI